MRSTDPLAIRTHRAWQPYTHTAKPLRPAARQQMFGPGIKPLHQPRNRLWFWLQFGIYAACTAYALDLWVVK
jgi:hypothetical protein